MQNSGNQPGVIWVFSAWRSFHCLSPNFIILVQFYQNFMLQTYVTTGIEQAEKTLKSTELQSGSQQQLTSHCAGDKSQTHRAATTETREVGHRASQSAGSDCPLPLHSTKSPSHTKVHFILPIALWGKSVKWNESVWALRHLRFSQSGQSSDSLGKFCLHSPYKDSDLVS